MKNFRLDVYIWINPLLLYDNCAQENYLWVEYYLGNFWITKFILTSDKTLIKGDFLIDNKPKIIGSVSEPKWEHVQFAQPYNEHVPQKRMSYQNGKRFFLEPNPGKLKI
jgi:5'-nucleotidase